MWEFMDERKVNSTATIFSLHARPKSRLLAFKVDITKLEAGFCIGDHNGDRLVFISSINSKGDIQFVDDEIRASWNPNWTQVNDIFEFRLDADYVFYISYKNKMFIILSWIWNHESKKNTTIGMSNPILILLWNMYYTRMIHSILFV